MKPKVRIGLMIVGIIVAGGVIAALKLQDAMNARMADFLDPKIGPRQTGLASVAPSEVLAKLDSMYRLPVDKRIVAAVARIASLKGETNVKATSEFQSDRLWHVGIGEKNLTTPEFPDFQSLELLLEASASSYALPAKRKASGKPTPRCSAVRSAELFRDLKALSQEWDRDQSASSLVSAARCYSILAFQLTDDTPLADPFVSQALALTYAAKESSGSPLYFERALLASKLGFRADALRLAKQAGTDGSKLIPFFTNDREKLRNQLKTVKTDQLGFYLALRNPASSSTPDEYIQAITSTDEASSAFYVVDAGARLQMFDLARSLLPSADAMLALEMQILEALDSEYPADPTKPGEFGKRMSKLYASFAKAGKSLDGSLVPAQAVENYYRAQLFGVLQSTAHFLIHQLGSQEAAIGFSQQVLGPVPVEEVKSLAAWIAAMTARAPQTEKRVKLVAAIAQPSALGAPIYRRTAAYHAGFFRDRAGQKMVPVELFAQAFDSRPSHRNDLIEMLAEFGAERQRIPAVCRSLIATEPEQYPSLQASTWYYRIGDHARSEKVLSLVKDTAETKLALLMRQKKAKEITIPVFTAGLRQLVDAFPDNAEVLYNYGDTLTIYGGDLAHGISALGKWFDTQSESLDSGNGMLWMRIGNRLSELLRDAGRNDEARTRIAALYPSQHAETFILAAMLFHDRSLPRSPNSPVPDIDSIYKLARERYGDDVSGALPQINVAWSEGDYGRAADFLAAAEAHEGLSSWGEKLAIQFHRTLKGRPIEERAKALRALSERGISPLQLVAIPQFYGSRIWPNEAFMLQEAIKMPAGELEFTTKFESFRYLQQARGHEAATAWLRKQIDPNSASITTIPIFLAKEYELLWQVFNEDDSNEFLWLPRAMASVRSGWDSAKYQERLASHYKRTPNGQYFTYGAFLLDLVPAQELEKMMGSPAQRANTAFYLGLKEEGKGNLRAAHDWYRVSVELDNWEGAESAWALTRLAEMRAEDFA